MGGGVLKGLGVLALLGVGRRGSGERGMIFGGVAGREGVCVISGYMRCYGKGGDNGCGMMR